MGGARSGVLGAPWLCRHQRRPARLGQIRRRRGDLRRTGGPGRPRPDRMGGRPAVEQRARRDVRGVVPGDDPVGRRGHPPAASGRDLSVGGPHRPLPGLRQAGWGPGERLPRSCSALGLRVAAHHRVDVRRAIPPPARIRRLVGGAEPVDREHRGARVGLRQLFRPQPAHPRVFRGLPAYRLGSRNGSTRIAGRNGAPTIPRPDSRSNPNSSTISCAATTPRSWTLRPSGSRSGTTPTPSPPSGTPPAGRHPTPTGTRCIWTPPAVRCGPSRSNGRRQHLRYPERDRQLHPPVRQQTPRSSDRCS